MAETDISKREVKPEAMGIPELARLYKVSCKVMKSWIKPIKEDLGKRIGQKYNPKQIRMIFEHLDPP